MTQGTQRYVGVSEKGVWWDIIDISNGMTEKTTVLIQSAIWRYWLFILNMIKEGNFENSPFQGKLSDLHQISHKLAF